MCDQLCPSCPFLPTNFKEFNAVAEELSKKHGQPKPDFFQCLTIRERVKADAIESGTLLCHSTVYDKDMTADLTKSHACRGLANHLKTAKPKPKRVLDKVR